MLEPDPAPLGLNTRLFVEEAAAWEPQKTRARLLDGELGAEHVTNGVVLPITRGENGTLAGGVLRADGTHVQSSRHLQHANDLGSAANVLGPYALEGPPVRRHGTAVFAGGGGKPRAFGHFLIEELARLWYLFKDPKYHDALVVFANPEHHIDDAGFRLLELAGIAKDRIVIVDEPTAFDEVVVPDQSLYLHPGSVHVAESKRTFDAIRAGAAPGPYEKVYLTYRQMGRSQLSVTVNEEMLEDLYRSNGFTVVAPEKLSVSEQIGIISGARELAGTAGTLSHLVAFAQDGVTLDIFVRDKRYMPEIQWGLNEMRGAHVNVVDTLRPLIPGNARRGVIYFTSTPEWAQFARARFGASEPASPPPDYAERYLVEWAQLLGRSAKWALELMPEWRASDLVRAIYASLLPSAELSDEQAAGLQRRFYAPEQRLRTRESESEAKATELEAKVTELNAQTTAHVARIRQLEAQLERMESSRWWRLTRPLRTASRSITRGRRR